MTTTKLPKRDTRTDEQVLLSCLRRVADDPDGKKLDLEHFPTGGYYRIRRHADQKRTAPIFDAELKEELGRWDQLIIERLEGAWL